MDLRVAAMGLTFVIFWSSAFTSARIAVVDAPPFLLLSSRFAVSGLLALILARALGQRIDLDRAAWRAVILLGVCQNTLYLGLIFMAVQWVEASIAAIIASALPLVVAAARWGLMRERLPTIGVVGLVAGMTGVLVIMSGRIDGGANLPGIVLCVGGLLSLTAATLLVSGKAMRGGVLVIVGLQMLVGSATLLPLSMALEVWEIRWTLNLGLAFAYLILIPGIAATFLWFTLVRRIGATRASSLHFLNPFFGVAIAALVLGEQFSAVDAAGVAVIMAGIYAVQRRPKDVENVT